MTDAKDAAAVRIETPAGVSIADRLAGPGATRLELTLGLGASAVGLAVGLVTALSQPWLWWEQTLVVLIAADLAGGVVVNAQPASRLWWHRPGRRSVHHIRFAALHVHPFIFAILLDEWSWGLAIGLYVAVVVGAAAVALSPRRLQEAVGLGCAGMIIAGATSWGGAPSVLVWLVPLYVLKLVVSHPVAGIATGSGNR